MKVGKKNMRANKETNPYNLLIHPVICSFAKWQKLSDEKNSLTLKILYPKTDYSSVWYALMDTHA